MSDGFDFNLSIVNIYSNSSSKSPIKEEKEDNIKSFDSIFDQVQEMINEMKNSLSSFFNSESHSLTGTSGLPVAEEKNPSTIDFSANGGLTSIVSLDNTFAQAQQAGLAIKPFAGSDDSNS